MQGGGQTTFETLSFRFNVLLAALCECLTLLVLALVLLILTCFLFFFFFLFVAHVAYARGVVNELAKIITSIYFFLWREVFFGFFFLV